MLLLEMYGMRPTHCNKETSLLVMVSDFRKLKVPHVSLTKLLQVIFIGFISEDLQTSVPLRCIQWVVGQKATENATSRNRQIFVTVKVAALACRFYSRQLLGVTLGAAENFFC